MTTVPRLSATALDWPADVPGRARREWPEWGLACGAVAMLVVGMMTTDLGRVDDLGLAPALGWPWWLGVGLWAASFATALRHRVPRARTMIGLLVIAVIALHGLPGIVEANPRFFSSWLHIGFIDQIEKTGRFFPTLDARFSWPGFFAFGATTDIAANQPSPLWMIRFAPVLFNLVYLSGVAAVARTATHDVRVKYTACAIFVIGNWFGQDYLSPQAAGFMVWLGVIVIALRVFPSTVRSIAAGPRWKRFRTFIRHDNQPDAMPPASQHRKREMIAVATFLAMVLAASHQLSPMMLLIATSALAISRRTQLRTLPVIVAVATLGWLSFGAEEFWIGHLQLLFGGLGDVGGNVTSGLVQRAYGPTFARQTIINTRLLLTGGTMVVAFIAWIRQYRRGRVHGALAILALAPWAMVGGQSYGGETLIRAALFALPSASVLIALSIIGPDGRWTLPSMSAVRRCVRTGAAALGAMVMSLAFMFARFGNESFEMVGTADIVAVRWVYANIPHGSTLLSSSRNLPWRFQDLTDYDYTPIDDQVLTDPGLINSAAAAHAGPAYLILSHAQELFATAIYGLAPGWSDVLRAELVASGQWHIVFKRDDAEVWKYSPTTNQITQEFMP